jgi:Flp pilus assembly protein TadG
MGNQRGQAIVLIALMLTIVIGMAAIAIDGSRAYALRRDMQAAVDSASLAAGDKLQQAGSWTTAEQAAANIFASNLRLYAAPSCTGWGSPGAVPFTVTCTYSDGTVLTEVAQDLGPQGSQFTMSARRNLQLQFARILTNGTSPAIVASSVGDVNNLRYTPAVGALNQAGCGASGSALTINGTGTLSVTGDVMSNGAISISAGAARVAGDIYARCQSPVPGSVTNACYPSGASTPCGYPDVAGATRSGFALAPPAFPAPVASGSQGLPTSNVVLPPGIYASRPSLSGGHCWFLSGGVYELLAGATNSGDFVSNELKPPDEPDPSSNTTRSANQFWDTDGVQCGGAVQVSQVAGPRGIPVGTWAFELTSVRTDSYGGVSSTRESAPSMCYAQNVNNSGQNIQVAVSNVPGATSYNIYAAPPPAGGTCTGPFGLVASIPVTVPVQNNNTTPCPLPVGAGCSLGNESTRLDATQLSSTFAPNAAAAPDTAGAYPPDGERAPLAVGLPNLNPSRGSGAAGDRANENACATSTGARASCPSAVTPGAVELYIPAGGCLSTTSGGDTYLFSGYQYNWISMYEPTSNSCANTLSAHDNSAYIGLFYTPSASVAVSSPSVFEAPAIGGLLAGSLSFTGVLPSIVYGSAYAPVPPATRLTS